ncbi:PREDICTED: uncharacterized protein LOC106113708 [Papilio xuthus]|uniref:Uncharacterized protein LOC106113708 n=1 Tax=Papilio xuthus TaxID=66420 RepID=A0AAJ6YZI5_PAPXU|nr:PREDICTED: uncharacterized protein LOC106113708 [Papilio xuthus]XP_013162023.1 PREDICTED: uncharacterized protein LOC106113708 [Papilio xuthus]
MHTSMKCCFCVPIKFGVVAFGIGSLIIFSVLVITSSIILGIEEGNEMTIASMKFKVFSINAILVSVLIVSMIAALFSILLIIGIFKYYPGLVLTYFAFGVLITMLMMLASLLFLINNYWYISLTSFLITAFYFYWLTVVYSVYGLIQKGDFSFDLEDKMDDALLIVE